MPRLLSLDERRFSKLIDSSFLFGEECRSTFIDIQVEHVLVSLGSRFLIQLYYMINPLWCTTVTDVWDNMSKYLVIKTMRKQKNNYYSDTYTLL